MEYIDVLVLPENLRNREDVVRDKEAGVLWGGRLLRVYVVE